MRTYLILRKSIFLTHIDKDIEIKGISNLEDLHLVNRVNIRYARYYFSYELILLYFRYKDTHIRITFNLK